MERRQERVEYKKVRATDTTAAYRCKLPSDLMVEEMHVHLPCEEKNIIDFQFRLPPSSPRHDFLDFSNFSGAINISRFYGVYEVEFAAKEACQFPETLYADIQVITVHDSSEKKE